jgi:hypothetical protein
MYNKTLSSKLAVVKGGIQVLRSYAIERPILWDVSADILIRVGSVSSATGTVVVEHVTGISGVGGVTVDQSGYGVLSPAGMTLPTRTAMQDYSSSAASATLNYGGYVKPVPFESPSTNTLDEALVWRFEGYAEAGIEIVAAALTGSNVYQFEDVQIPTDSTDSVFPVYPGTVVVTAPTGLGNIVLMDLLGDGWLIGANSAGTAYGYGRIDYNTGIFALLKFSTPPNAAVTADYEAQDALDPSSKMASLSVTYDYAPDRLVSGVI